MRVKYRGKRRQDYADTLENIFFFGPVNLQTQTSCFSVDKEKAGEGQTS